MANVLTQAQRELACATRRNIGAPNDGADAHVIATPLQSWVRRLPQRLHRARAQAFRVLDERFEGATVDEIAEAIRD